MRRRLIRHVPRPYLMAGVLASAGGEKGRAPCVQVGSCPPRTPPGTAAAAASRRPAEPQSRRWRRRVRRVGGEEPAIAQGWGAGQAGAAERWWVRFLQSGWSQVVLAQGIIDSAHYRSA